VADDTLQGYHQAAETTPSGEVPSPPLIGCWRSVLHQSEQLNPMHSGLPAVPYTPIAMQAHQNAC
jgi:hypothetical protein